MQNKPVAEHLPQIRISSLKAQGLLSDNYWKDEYYANSTDPFCMLFENNNGFRYRLKVFGHRRSVEVKWDIGSSHYQANPVLIKDGMNFGGHRFWFVCPNCSDRCGVLYIIQNVCGCNKCLPIAYASQNRTKGMPWTLEERHEQAKLLTDLWTGLWQQGRFFYANRPTKEYLHYLVTAYEIWGDLFPNPQTTIALHQAHDPLLFKPPNVLINKL